MKRKFLKRILYGSGLTIALFVLFMLTPSVHGYLWPDRAPIGYHFLWSSYLAVAVGLEELIDTAPEVPEGVEVLRDIEYKEIEDKVLQRDIYRPKEMVSNAALLIHVHVGSWHWGHRSDMAILLVDFAQLGYVTATISYRLEGYPAAVWDVSDGIDWLYNHSEVYGYDRNRIALVGASAGAHLSMLVAYGWSGASQRNANADRVK